MLLWEKYYFTTIILIIFKQAKKFFIVKTFLNEFFSQLIVYFDYSRIYINVVVKVTLISATL